LLKYFLFKRFLEEVSNDLRVNDMVVLTVGTNTALGNIVKATKDTIELVLDNSVVVEQGQKIAISKKQKTALRNTKKEEKKGCTICPKSCFGFVFVVDKRLQKHCHDGKRPRRQTNARASQHASQF
jgi:hypothetical protein